MKTSTEEKSNGKIAVVRVRGSVNLNPDVYDTLDMLRLYRKNYCVVLNNTPSIMGMIKKINEVVTWGEIDDDTLKLLVSKRAEKTENREGKEEVRKFFRLQPPRKGFGRKGIKIPFKMGGALGYRGEKINDLIRRMI